MKSVAVVIPVMNEEEIISDAIDQINNFESQPNEIIIVNNGSTDNTYEILLELQNNISNLSVYNLTYASIGKAQKLGLQKSHSDVNVMFDADYIDEEFYNRVINSKADVCISSKRERNSLDNRGLLRKSSTYIFTKLSKFLLKTNLNDTHGVKSFSKSVVHKHLSKCGDSGHVFDTELCIRAEKAGAKIEVWPATVEELRPARTSIIKRAPIALVELVRLRSRLKTD